MANTLKVTLVKSPIGAVPKHKLTVKAMGLTKMHKTVEMPDNAATRGMIQQVQHLVKVEEGSKHSDNFRRGRGHGSGNGKTAGKGHKGQLARSGHKKPGFEGGQMPLYRRLPKRGFTNRNSKEIIAINVDVLNRFEDGAEVTVESLLASSAISKAGDGVKILGNGELTKKLTVKVNAVSETAKSKIEAAGGTVELI